MRLTEEQQMEVEYQRGRSDERESICKAVEEIENPYHLETWPPSFLTYYAWCDAMKAVLALMEEK